MAAVGSRKIAGVMGGGGQETGDMGAALENGLGFLFGCLYQTRVHVPRWVSECVGHGDGKYLYM